MKEYKNSEMFRLISEYVHVERDRRIMFDKLLNGLTVDEMAKKYYTSTSAINRTITKYQDYLFSMVS